ncbi:hypothetical protein [Halostagnicola sp. A-GB9-2]|uniref:hypothetical protein n=1 Tax=Halostagnicola sp. A-GB9-2 TaxID=3048066 RepID=UPI0024C0556F|nr:hypothetical protein [Halostagnicola sp. A-GB9-2]MDJ1434031.1 hypothetical protein [Halostagnicola sp. A-GB9-2]
MDRSSQSPMLYALLGVALLVTVLVHLSVLPRYYPGDLFMTALTLVVGWLTFAIVWYLTGRIYSTPGELPTMRSADIGLGLFLVSLLIALFMDSMGFTPETVLEAFVLPAIGIYVGLALLGWSIGRRTKAINRISS